MQAALREKNKVYDILKRNKVLMQKIFSTSNFPANSNNNIWRLNKFFFFYFRVMMNSSKNKWEWLCYVYMFIYIFVKEHITYRSDYMWREHNLCYWFASTRQHHKRRHNDTQSCFWIYNFTFFSVCFRIPCEIVVDFLNVNRK